MTNKTLRLKSDGSKELEKRVMYQRLLREKVVLSPEEASDYLGIAKSLLYRYVGESTIPYFKVGPRYKFNREHLDEWRLSQCNGKNERG